MKEILNKTEVKFYLNSFISAINIKKLNRVERSFVIQHAIYAGLQHNYLNNLHKHFKVE